MASSPHNRSQIQPLAALLDHKDVGPRTERGNILLRLLAGTAAGLLAAKDGDAVARGVFERIAPTLDLHAYFNFMVNDEGDAMHLASCAGIPEEEARAISRLEFGQAVCGTVAVLRRPIVATHIQQSSDPKVQIVRGYGIRAYACNPLMAGDRLLGTLSFATRSRDRFEEDELEFFRTISHYVSVTEERIRLTAALRQQATLLDLAQDAIIATGLDGAVQFWSRGAEQLYGWKAAEARGRRYSELLSGALPRSLDQIRGQLASRPVWEAELEHPRRDGQTVQVWSRWAARYGPEGRQTGFLILEHDLSERSRMEQQLRQAQKLESLGVLAGGIAHDFNNLLTGILGNASLLKEDVAPEAVPYLDRVIQGAERAADLTRQLLAYAGKGRVVSTEINLSALLRETASLLRVSVPRTIEIQVDLAPDAPPITADAGQIQQVVMNLVINASEAVGSQNKGVVIIRTGTEMIGEGDASLAPGRYVVVTVSDNGSGMDKETIARIFDPFFTTKFAGRGLGLSAVLGIMRTCKGRISVDSRMGEGSTFRLFFPATAASQEQAIQAHSTAFAFPKGTTVLVVDDEPTVREIARSALARSGATVLLAENGQQAIQLIGGAARIDVVLLDIIMPVMGGVQALAEIRRRCPAAKIVITSGYGAEEVGRLCSGDSGYGFVPKPFRSQDLLEKVVAALQEAPASIAAD